MSDRVAEHVEPATTTMAVQPSFGEVAFRIGPHEKKLRPFRIFEFGRILWTGDMRLSAVAEFCFVPFAAPGAVDIKHLVPS
nr:hypothetical protein [Sneathiella litorea]